MPIADFLMVGGASLATLAIFWILSDGWFGLKLAGAPWWAFCASFAINYPHFIFSYQLFYPGFWRRLTAKETTPGSKLRLSVVGIIAPLAMIAYFIFAWFAQDTKYLGWAVFAMVFSVGWHYVKQAYGVFITLSLYKNVFYDIWSKRILWLNAYVVWIYTWTRANRSAYTNHYYDVGYTTSSYPPWIEQSFLVIMYITTFAAVVVLLRNKKGFSLGAAVGYGVALYSWMVLPFSNAAFYVFVPFFHSLQYLPFVYKFKKSQYLEKKAAMNVGDAKPNDHRCLVLWLVSFVFFGVAVGALAFVFGPAYIDKNLATEHVDKEFFAIAIVVFINIHHFFIDNAFWRRDNADVQKYLFKA